MFRIRRPAADDIRQLIEAQRQQQFTYPDIGNSRTSQTPPGFTSIQYRSNIGTGADSFERAKQALLGWQMLNLAWLETVFTETPAATDSIVATLARSLGLYTLNVGRVIYVDDGLDDSGALRFSLGYGTLPEYALAGEERFSVDWDQETQQVCFEIYSFSRPHHWLSRLGLFHVRRLQQRFCRDSTKKMQSICQT